MNDILKVRLVELERWQQDADKRIPLVFGPADAKGPTTEEIKKTTETLLDGIVAQCVQCKANRRKSMYPDYPCATCGNTLCLECNDNKGKFRLCQTCRWDVQSRVIEGQRGKEVSDTETQAEKDERISQHGAKMKRGEDGKEVETAFNLSLEEIVASVGSLRNKREAFAGNATEAERQFANERFAEADRERIAGLKDALTQVSKWWLKVGRKKNAPEGNLLGADFWDDPDYQVPTLAEEKDHLEELREKNPEPSAEAWEPYGITHSVLSVTSGLVGQTLLDLLVDTGVAETKRLARQWLTEGRILVEGKVEQNGRRTMSQGERILVEQPKGYEDTTRYFMPEEPLPTEVSEEQQ